MLLSCLRADPWDLRRDVCSGAQGCGKLPSCARPGWGHAGSLWRLGLEVQTRARPRREHGGQGAPPGTHITAEWKREETSVSRSCTGSRAGVAPAWGPGLGFVFLVLINAVGAGGREDLSQLPSLPRPHVWSRPWTLWECWEARGEVLPGWRGHGAPPGTLGENSPVRLLEVGRRHGGF